MSRRALAIVSAGLLTAGAILLACTEEHEVSCLPAVRHVSECMGMQVLFDENRTCPAANVDYVLALSCDQIKEGVARGDLKAESPGGCEPDFDQFGQPIFCLEGACDPTAVGYYPGGCSLCPRPGPGGAVI